MKTLPNYYAAIIMLFCCFASVEPVCVRAQDLFANSDPVTKARHKAQESAEAYQDQLTVEEKAVYANLETCQKNYLDSAVLELRKDAEALGTQPDETKLQERAKVKAEEKTVVVRALAKTQLDNIAALRKENEDSLNQTIAQLDKAGNGDVERAVRVAYDFADKRWENGKREKTPDAELLKALTDVSVADIFKYGPLGGPESVPNRLIVSVGLQHFCKEVSNLLPIPAPKIDPPRINPGEFAGWVGDRLGIH